jgi:hypothetical protein
MTRIHRDVLSVLPVPGKGAVLPTEAYAGAMPNLHREEISTNSQLTDY